ncbi:MAG: hypothetical protein U0974_15185, partial [Gemmatimonadales bacterium]|nr:hypothetical protein [Gemmatimonadales bacterium]
GMTTRYFRTDPVVPALVTRVDYPNSRRALLQWNSRGNLTRLADSTWGPRALPTLVSTWSYNAATAPDSPSLVTGPAGEVTSYSYTTLGLTDSVIDPRGHRTKFVYADSADSVRGQVVQLIERAVPTWIENSQSEATVDLVTALGYDASGNTRQVTSPSGGLTRMGRDADGRIIADTNAVGLWSAFTWDAMDRQTRRIVGRKAAGELPSGCLDLEFTCADSLVQDALNPAGTADTTRATYTQGVLTQITDPRGVPRSYRYDLRGLMVAEIDEAGAVDSARYDPAGLLTTHRTRLGVDVTNSYDVMDRVTKTVIPGRTLTFFGFVNGNVPADSVLVSYDSLGNVLSMANRNAVITRSYYETGHLRSERVVPVENRALADSTGYAYDGAGRLRRVMWQSGDSVVYRYTVAGDLDTMRVFWRTSGAPRSE